MAFLSSLGRRIPQQWRGGDQSILDEIKNRTPTDPVRFKWVYDERSRIVELFERGDDQFVPFYVGKRKNWRIPRGG